MRKKCHLPHTHIHTPFHQICNKLSYPISTKPLLKTIDKHQTAPLNEVCKEKKTMIVDVRKLLGGFYGESDKLRFLVRYLCLCGESNLESAPIEDDELGFDQDISIDGEANASVGLDSAKAGASVGCSDT